jgi:hypothetical protein
MFLLCNHVYLLVTVIHIFTGHHGECHINHTDNAKDLGIFLDTNLISLHFFLLFTHSLLLSCFTLVRSILA